jgi:hypothetical protein
MSARDECAEASSGERAAEGNPTSHRVARTEVQDGNVLQSHDGERQAAARNSSLIDRGEPYAAEE